MTPEQPTNVSVIDPVGSALEKVKLILFKPFDLTKWFVIGFCAWLAYLGKGAGGPNFNFSGGQYNRDFETQQAINHAKEFIHTNLHWLIPLAVFMAIIGIAVWLVITWLSSRGRFMFLHCVARNKAEVKIPWTKFKRHANSLFLFRIVLSLIAFAIMLLLGLITFFFIVAAKTGGVVIPILLLLVIAVPIFIVVGIVFFLIHKFTTDFVVPIMFLQTTNCIAAWRHFWALLSSNLGRFTLYLLFQIVISIAIGAILIAAVLATCCCAACVFMLPYIGTVAMLPLFVFKRAYSLCYFSQYGPDFDCFAPEAVEQ